jgi:membrane-bound lytic murein transglycosylase D
VGVSAAYIRRFNPNLLKGMTPPDVQTYSLWIPEDKAEALEDAKVKLTKTTITQASFSVSETATARRYYRVRHGDGLSAIAKMHGVSLSKLKRVNRLRTNRVYTGQRLRIPVASI